MTGIVNNKLPLLHLKMITETFTNCNMIILRDYQNDALCNMHNGCILNGGVGSGKSLTSLAYYYKLFGGQPYYYKRNDQDLYSDGPYLCGTNQIIETKNKTYIPMTNPCDLYIITTARKRDTNEWEYEMKNLYIHPDSTINKYNNNVIIDSWNNIVKYVDIKNAFFIFDEQRVVGYGKWVKSFLKITKSNQWILLSATPGDKWEDYIPVFIANGYFKNKSEFCRNHAVYSRYTKFPKIEKYINTGYLNKLRKNILIEMDFERTTIRHHEHVVCDYDIDKYKFVTQTKWNIYKDKPIENAGEYCLVLRRLVNSDISRQINLLKIIDNHPKALIFYNQDYELDILRELFNHYPHAEWNGHKHEALPTGDAWVYLVQYTAGCEGWNCITTDTIIFFSQNYSYKVMEQASGRIDRMNTPYQDLWYYHFRSESKIDQQIRMALRRKKKFNENCYSKMFEKQKETEEINCQLKLDI